MKIEILQGKKVTLRTYGYMLCTGDRRNHVWDEQVTDGKKKAGEELTQI
jgi:hypothetical protein